MKTLGRIGIFAAMFAACLGVALADTIKLKNGSALEGVILSEDDKQLTVEVHHAGGSIVTTQTVAKSDVAEIKRMTADERAAQDRARTVAELQKLQLDPTTSLTLPQYDAAIQKFQKFLAQNPQAPEAKGVTDQLALWQAERQQVAGGQAKYRGAWMTAEAATKLARQDRIQQMMAAARTAMTRGKFGEALQQLDALGKFTGAEAMPADAVALRTEALTKYRERLEQSRSQLSADLKLSTDHLTQAQAVLARARADLKDHQASGPGNNVSVSSQVMTPGSFVSSTPSITLNGRTMPAQRQPAGYVVTPVGPGGVALNVGDDAQYTSAYNRAQLDVNETARRVAQLSNDLNAVQIALAELQARQ